MDNIILTPVPLEKLIDTFRAIVREEVRAEITQKDSTLLITGNEVRQLFKPAISRSTLVSYVKKGLIPQQSIGGRLYYQKGAVLEAVAKIKRYNHQKQVI